MPSWSRWSTRNGTRHEFDEFVAAQQARPGYYPTLWFVADLDGEPAGVLIARDPASGPWVAWLGVAERARATEWPGTCC